MTIRRAIPAVLCTGALWLSNTPVAAADNCGSPSDCFGASASAAVAAFGLLGLALLWWLLDSTTHGPSTNPAPDNDLDEAPGTDPQGDGQDWWSRTIGIARNMAEAARERAEVEPDQPDQGPTNEDSARHDIITRAKSWKEVPYSAKPHKNEFGAYRADCSGFVSMAWGLPTQPDTEGLQRSYATKIKKEELQPGDILLNHTGKNRHVVIFEKWADPEKMDSYWAYEQAYLPGYTVHREIPWKYDAGYEPHLYEPYRYNKLGVTTR